MNRATDGAKAWARKPREAMAPMSKTAKARRVTWAAHLRAWLAMTPNPRCQVCGHPINAETADKPHHKMLRSKGGGDGPENLLGLHRACHTWLHDGLMGAQTDRARWRTQRAAQSPANLTNTLKVDWSADAHQA